MRVVTDASSTQVSAIAEVEHDEREAGRSLASRSGVVIGESGTGQRHTGSIKLGSNLRTPLPAGWIKIAERL
jgi:hypothetical protein